MDQSSLPLPGPGGYVCPDCEGSISVTSQTALPPFAGVGIDIGSVSVKVCGLSDGTARSTVIAHEGDIEAALDKAFAELSLDRQAAPLRW
jgi:hypothetical protein